MNQMIDALYPTAEILLAAGVLREVGYDEAAEKFKAALFDRRLLPEAISALEMLVRNPQSDDSRKAKEAAFRTYQKLQKLT